MSKSVPVEDVEAGHVEAGADELYESRTNPKKVQQERKQRAQTSILSELSSKRLWMGISALLLVINVVSPIILVKLLSKDQLVIAIDGANTFHIGPGADFVQSDQLITTHGVLAALALLQRSPIGFDLPEMLQQLFTPGAKEKATKELATVMDELKSKNERWRPEVSKVEMGSIEGDRLFALRVTGQLLKNGVAAGQAYEVPYNFTLLLRFVRNPKLTQNAKYPLVVYDFEFRLDKRADGNGMPGSGTTKDTPAARLLNDVNKNRQAVP